MVSKIKLGINCGHSDAPWGYYLTWGKQSPVIGPNVGIHEGEFNRAIAERLLKLIPGSEILTSGAFNVTQRTRRDGINRLAGMMAKDDMELLVLNLHANAAQNSGWQTGATGARIFTRKCPWKTARIVDWEKSTEVANRIDQALRAGPLPYPVRPRLETNRIGILKVKCPSILCEAGFQDNPYDASYMASEIGRDEYAGMLHEGLQGSI